MSQMYELFDKAGIDVKTPQIMQNAGNIHKIRHETHRKSKIKRTSKTPRTHKKTRN